MSAVFPLTPKDPRSSHLVELTMRAFALAASAAGKAADAMGGAKLDLLGAIKTDEEELDAIDKKINDVVEETVRFAEESPWPDDNELLKDVYADQNYPFIVD